MNNNLWIGIGAIIKTGDPLYSDLKKINDYLTKDMSGGFGYSDALRPHVNFYDLAVPSDSIEKIKESLTEALADQETIACKISGIGSFKFGLIYAQVEKNERLIELHQKILNAVNPYHGDVIDPDYEKLIPVLSEEQKQSLNRFGNPYMTDFKPHITLGYLPDKKDVMDTIVPKLELMLAVREFVVHRVDFVKGKTSDAIEVVAEYEFKQEI